MEHSKSLVVLEGGFRIERWLGEPDWEYKTPGGATLLIPFTQAPVATRYYASMGQALQFVKMAGARLLDKHWAPNLIVDEGLETFAKFLAQQYAGVANTGAQKIEIGDGAGATVVPDEDDSAIVATANRARVTVNTPTWSGGDATVAAPFTAGQSNYVIRELALYANTTSASFGVGDMIDHSAYLLDNTSPNTALTVSGVISFQRKAAL